MPRVRGYYKKDYYLRKKRPVEHLYIMGRTLGHFKFSTYSILANQNMKNTNIPNLSFHEIKNKNIANSKERLNV